MSDASHILDIATSIFTVDSIAEMSDRLIAAGAVDLVTACLAISSAGVKMTGGNGWRELVVSGVVKKIEPGSNAAKRISAVSHAIDALEEL